MRDSRKNKFDRRGVPKVIKDNNRKPAFEYECFSQIPHVSPLAMTVNDFDYEAVFSAFGEGTDASAIHHDQIAEQVHEILQWLVRGSDLKKIGRRAVALGSVVSPEMFKDVPPEKMTKMLGWTVMRIRSGPTFPG